MTMRTPIVPVLVVTLFFAVGPRPACAASSMTKEAIESGGRKRTCYVYVPQHLSSDSPAPVLLLFHGSGRDGTSLVDEWKRLADSEGIVLAAPDALDRRQWVIPDDGPALLGDIVAFLRSRYRIDSRRIYAFGHSAGAGFALQMAPLESTFLAAVAVHAGAFAGGNDPGILRLAERKVPLFFVVGTRDPYFPVELVRRTQSAFSSAGFPTEFREIPGHDHNYYVRSKEINGMVWAFLSRRHLDADGHFSAYRIEASAAGVAMTPIDSP